MFLIVGLGNPEPEYANTRHNMGFDVINKLSEKYAIQMNKSKFKGIYGMGNIDKEKVILLKPQTYMNLSGESIRMIIDFYKIPIENVILIYDDIDLQNGIVKIRKNGGAGTHNGMKSVIEHLNTKNFIRIRIGIGMPEDKSRLIEHVITKIKDEEEKQNLAKAITIGAKAVEEILKSGIDTGMNKIN